MSYCDLLERMMQRDTTAFLEMTDQYGWALYSEIRKKYPNKADADRIYDETMQYIYRSMQNPVCEDPMEAILCAFADKLAERQGLRAETSAIAEPVEDIQPPRVELVQSKADMHVVKHKRKKSFWYRIGMLLVMAGFAAVVWIGLGLLMEAGMIPYYDLGYSWLSEITAQWI